MNGAVVLYMVTWICLYVTANKLSNTPKYPWDLNAACQPYIEVFIPFYSSRKYFKFSDLLIIPAEAKHLDLLAFDIYTSFNFVIVEVMIMITVCIL